MSRSTLQYPKQLVVYLDFVEGTRLNSDSVANNQLSQANLNGK